MTEGHEATYHDRPNPGWTGVVVGLFIAGLGLVLLLDQTGLLGWQPSWSLWPFLIFGAGLARFVTPKPDGSREGGWLMFIGAWLMLTNVTAWRVRDTWPLLLVALGVHHIWQATVRRPPPGTSQTGHRS